MICRRTRWAPSPHPNSGLPEFGTLSWPKSDKSDFGWGKGTSGDIAPAVPCDAVAALWANAVRGRSREVEVALVLNELRDGDVLERDRILGICGDYGVPIPIIVCGGQQLLEIGKDGVIDFDHIRLGVEIADGDVAEIGREHESIAPREPGRGGGRGGRLHRRADLRAVAGGIAGCWQKVRREVARGIGTG